MAMQCRLIVDAPQRGAWNMAVDEALLIDAADDGIASLRLYEWSEPTLSIGYFQKHADRHRHGGSATLPIVRRASGGGALVHHHEVTYSLALPAEHPAAKSPEDLYDSVHVTLVDWLNKIRGIEDSEKRFLMCPQADSRRPSEQPFLCFRRRAKGDILAHPPANHDWAATEDGLHKVCGSAQRRRSGAVLQHGGLLLQGSQNAPELPGIVELTGLKIEKMAILDDWLPQVARKLELDLEPCDLPQQARLAAEKVATDKFTSQSWLQRR